MAIWAYFADQCRLNKISYDAVFAIAIALVILDILLRLIMIEQKTASKWINSPITSETDSLLSGSSGDDNATYQAIGQKCPEVSINPRHSICWPDEDGKRRKSSSIPPILRLACSRGVLFCLGATVVDAILWSSFDTVCGDPFRLLFVNLY
jgi:hypothetical protein